jgi:GNAT superfamily N-acetyltransferase
VTYELEEVRLAVKDDLASLGETIEAAYRKYLTRMNRPPGPMLQDLRPLIEAKNLWVVGRPITGIICLLAQDDALLVEIVAVHPDAQGTGLGRHLMDFAEDEARRNGVSRLWLYTNEVMVENVSLYSHLGYREFDRGYQAGYNRIFMEKVLRPAGSTP